MINSPHGRSDRCILVLLFMVLIISTFAQNKTELFTTVDGKRFTRAQRDSIEQLGNFIGVKEKHLYGDTIVYSIFYYDESFLLSPFQKRFVDKPFPDFKLLSLQDEWISAAELKGKVTFIYFCVNTLYEEEDVLIQMNDLHEKYGERIHFVAFFPLDANGVTLLMKKFRLSFKLIPAKSFMETLAFKEDTWFMNDVNGMVKNAEQAIPVDMRFKPDGTSRDEGDPFKVIVYEWYSERLEKLLAAK